MKQILLTIFSVLAIIGCSTTNRQVIFECDGGCYKTTRPRANVVAKMSADNANMVVTNSAVINYTK